LIHSQNTFDTNSIENPFSGNIDEPEFFKKSRPITYRNLNEALKIAKAEIALREKDSLQQAEIAELNNVIKSKDSVIDRYDNYLIPKMKEKIGFLENKSTLLEVKLEKEYELNAIRDEKWELKFDKLKSKRFSIGLGGNYGLGENGTGFNAGVGLYYTLFRL
tara:strand:+ start:9587 stop:10072 length:486 start_codon:yes stop_codon:yes gene_type:complete